MAQKIAERFIWAVDMLNVAPDDHLLEIGCGHGLAVALICDKLTTGRIMALDRSATMIDTARKRNTDCAESGKAVFQVAAIEQAGFGASQFDKIFAINVNVFWMKPEKELAVIKQCLKPDGALYLFYEPPTPDKIPEMVDKLKVNLERNGLGEVQVTTKESLVCVRAKKVGYG